MTIDEIKTAVRAGRRVFWHHKGYEVKLFTFPDGREQWLVKHLSGHWIGLTWADGVTMNGKPEEFIEL